MAIVGIGIDIESINKFRELKFEENKEFYGLHFTESEIEYCLKNKDPAQHFAARFCAKEAFMKALGEPTAFVSIEVSHTEKMKPILTWKLNPAVRAHLSLSHEQDKATAVVIIEKD